MLADKLLHPQSLVELETWALCPDVNCSFSQGDGDSKKIGIYRELWHMLSL